MANGDQGEVPLGRRWRLPLLSGLYAIADGSGALPPLALIDGFLRAGVTVVQLRLKQAGAGELLRIARAAVRACRERGAILLVNDRPDVARLAGADGVHLGQDDLPVEEARAVLGGEAIVGISTHSEAELDRALAAGADYVGFGPIFATATKAATAPFAPALPAPHGPQGLARAAARARGVPVIAIGGITAANAGLLAGTGALGIAAIGELCASGDPEARARALIAAFAPSRGSIRAG
jgi:thiamine-phosphate pyrophosphorylase